MARVNANRLSIYDVMDAKGVFEQNPANATAPGHVKLRYPKMYYHPEGAQRQTSPGEIVVTPMGAQELNKQFELVSKVANNEAEARDLEDDGWHDHPAKALQARGGVEVPEMSAQGKLDDQASEIETLRRQLADSQAALAKLKAPAQAAPPAKPGVRQNGLEIVPTKAPGVETA